MSPSDKTPDEGRGEISPQEREAFRKRAQELGRELETVRGQVKSHDPRAAGQSSSASGEAMGRALRVSTELIGGVVVGSALGWVLDKWLNTWPLLFVVFFLLGSAAGMLNVVRASSKLNTGPSNPKPGPPVRDDEDETT